MKNLLKYPLALAVMAGVIPGSLSAATIAWTDSVYTNTGATKNVLGVDQFDQSGELEYAINMGGAAFTFSNTVDPDIAFTASNANFDASALTGSAAVFYSGNVGNNQLANTARYAGGGEKTITMNNLTIGQTYRIQILLMDGRAAANGAYATFDSHTTGAFGNGVSGVTWGDSLLVTGTFTADSTSQSFQHRSFYSPSNPSGGQMNAVLLYAIPEPSSMALLGLAGVAMLIRRKR